jgi:hypothetical protein
MEPGSMPSLLRGKTVEIRGSITCSTKYYESKQHSDGIKSNMWNSLAPQITIIINLAVPIAGFTL